MFHQVAVLAHELRRLHRDDPGVEGFEPLVARRGRCRDLILVVGRFLLSILGLLLGQQILDGLHVLQARLRRHGGLRQLLRRGFEVFENLVVLESDLYLLVHVFIYVVDVLGHLGSSFVVPWGGLNPPPSARILHLARADATREGAHALNARGCLGIPVPAPPRHRERKMRTQGTFGAATPGRRVLYSASWVLTRLRRGGDAARTVSGARWAGQPPAIRKSDRRPSMAGGGHRA